MFYINEWVESSVVFMAILKARLYVTVKRQDGSNDCMAQDDTTDSFHASSGIGPKTKAN